MRAANVVISALKRSEDGQALVLRLYETDGKDTPVCISGRLLRTPLTLTLPAYSMRTLMLPDDQDCWREVLLSELDK